MATFIYLWNTNEEFRQFWINLWESIKQAAITAWNAIGEFLKSAWEGIRNTCQTIFNAIKTFFQTVWNGIKNIFSTAVGAVKTVVTNAWNAIKTVTSTVWNGIKSVVTGTITAIKNGISTGLTAAKNTVTNILNGIKNAFSTVWEGAKNIVSGAIEKIKGMMNFHWELPKLKLPHFSITGKFSLDPPSIPKIGVEWYRKAMGDGMILDSPTIFGAAGGKLLAGGEAGPEAVVGVDSLRTMIQEAVAGQTAVLAQAIGAAGSGDITIPVYVGGTLLDEMVVTAQNRQNLRSGGR